MELLLATTNAGKLVEVRSFLRRLPLKVLSLQSLGRWPASRRWVVPTQ
jgi:inosine/xanthosine triphosphate pyrophosphatase family protein